MTALGDVGYRGVELRASTSGRLEVRVVLFPSRPAVRRVGQAGAGEAEE